jgi:high frequency lysogenization protein
VPYTEHDRVLALAGIYQAVHCVQQIARRGLAASNEMETSIYSLFQTDPPTVEAVFRGASGVAAGARQLGDQLAGGVRRNLELTRYAIQLLQLERKLSADPAMLGRVAAGIAEVRPRLEQLPLLHPDVLAALAELYSRTISRLQPRIIVQGEPLHLKNPDNVHRIRSLLLAGLRAAVLWRQSGGTRWQILLGRRRLLAQARALAGASANTSG